MRDRSLPVLAATCTVTMNANTAVTATFNEAKNITAAPAAIDLGAINVGSTVLRTINVSNTGATTNLPVRCGHSRAGHRFYDTYRHLLEREPRSCSNLFG